WMLCLESGRRRPSGLSTTAPRTEPSTRSTSSTRYPGSARHVSTSCASWSCHELRRDREFLHAPAPAREARSLAPALARRIALRGAGRIERLPPDLGAPP